MLQYSMYLWVFFFFSEKGFYSTLTLIIDFVGCSTLASPLLYCNSGFFKAVFLECSLLLHSFMLHHAVLICK